MRVESFLLALTVAGGVSAFGGAARTSGGTATARQTTVDPGTWKSQMSVFTDGGSRVVAVVLPDPEREGDPDLKATLFYGDASQLEAQNVARYDGAGMRFEVGFDDPSMAYSPAGALKREEGVVTLSCGGEAKMTALPADEASALLAKARLVSSRNLRRPHSLATAPDGTAYYSDVNFFDQKTNEYRVRVGKKGSWKDLAVTDEEHDPNWNWIELATASGSLRIEYLRGGEMKTMWKTTKGDNELKAVKRDDLWEKAGAMGLVAGDTGTPCASLAK
jgi:hypothetical protein